MATNRYFTNFPVINYNSLDCLNITERVVFLQNALRNPYLFYPYDLAENERADQLADRYFGDSYKSWMLYLGNKIIDPYYGWYLNNVEFNEYIINTYGSQQLAQSKTAFYQNNWYGSTNISINTYDALTNNQLKYWTPIFDAYGTTIAYTRQQSNNTITTNSIRSYAVSNTAFVNDEIVNIHFSSTYTGSGQVKSVTSNTVYLQHIQGYSLTSNVVSITANSYLYGQQSGVNTHFTVATNVIDTINPDEVIYWSPVSYYDYESAKNEYNKSILILNKSYAANVANSLKALL